MVNQFEVGSVLCLYCVRWNSPAWETNEVVSYKVRIERTTEKAVLLVDETSPARRWCWLPKNALRKNARGECGWWTNAKLDAARFSETGIEWTNIRIPRMAS